jgi:phosphatidylinositol phospholipase C delta
MSDLPPPLNPSRSLRRAGNILSPDGQLTKDFTHFDGGDSHPSSPTRHLSFAGKNGLGASIKRRFEDFKVQSRMGRSKSFNDAPAGSQSIPILADNRRHKGHSKSLAIERHSLQADLSTPAAISDIVPAPRTPAVLPTITGETVIGNVMVPQLLQQGTPMTKVSLKTHKKVVFRLDADLGQMVWESKQQKISEDSPTLLSFHM